MRSAVVLAVLLVCPVIAGFIKCYEEGCYFVDADGRVNGDFEAADKVWQKYGHKEGMAY